MWEIVLTNLLLGAVTAVLGLIGKAVNDWTNRQKVQEEKRDERNAHYEAIDALETAVTSVGETFVNGVKAAATDGKLSKSEIETARDMAWNEATTIVVGPALDLITSWSRDAITTIINSIVGNRKEASPLP